MNTCCRLSRIGAILLVVGSLSHVPRASAADAAPSGATSTELAPATTTTPPPVARARPDPAIIAADALIVRPVSLAATAVGAAIFVVALPFAAITRDVKGVGAILVGQPARYTFERPLGDFDSP